MKRCCGKMMTVDQSMTCTQEEGNCTSPEDHQYSTMVDRLWAALGSAENRAASLEARLAELQGGQP